MSEKLDAQRQQEYDFFHKTKCDRCGGPLTIRTLSMFNMDVICSACKDAERQRPDYDEAVKADIAECKKGNRNFEGIGLKDITTTVGKLTTEGSE